VLDDNHWQLGVFAGYDWAPWRNKDNALRNISIIPWLGANFLPNAINMSRVFENTGSVYDIPEDFRSTIGLNISYTFFQQ